MAEKKKEYVEFTGWEDLEKKKSKIGAERMEKENLKARMKRMVSKAKVFDFKNENIKMDIAYTELEKTGSPAVSGNIKNLADNSEFPFVVSYGKIHFKAEKMSLEQLKNLRAFLHFNNIENFVLPEGLDEQIAEEFKKLEEADNEEKKEKILHFKESQKDGKVVENKQIDDEQEDGGPNKQIEDDFREEVTGQTDPDDDSVFVGGDYEPVEIELPEWEQSARAYKIPTEETTTTEEFVPKSLKKYAKRPEDVLKYILEYDGGKYVYKEDKNMLYSFSLTGVASFKLYDGDSCYDKKGKTKTPTATIYLKQTKKGLNINIATAYPNQLSDTNANIIMKTFKELDIYRVNISGIIENDRNEMAKGAAKNLVIPTGVNFPPTLIAAMHEGLTAKKFNDIQLLDYKEKWLAEMERQARLRGKTCDEEKHNEQKEKYKAAGMSEEAIAKKLNKNYKDYETLQNDVLKLRAKSLKPVPRDIPLTTERVKIILDALKEENYGVEQVLYYKKQLLNIIKEQSDARGTELISGKNATDKLDDASSAKPLDHMSQVYETLNDEVNIVGFKHLFYQARIKPDLAKAGEEEPDYSKENADEKKLYNKDGHKAFRTIGTTTAAGALINMVNREMSVEGLMRYFKSIERSWDINMKGFNDEDGYKYMKALKKSEEIKSLGRPADFAFLTGSSGNLETAVKQSLINKGQKDNGWEKTRISDLDPAIIEKIYAGMKETYTAKAYRDSVEQFMDYAFTNPRYDLESTIRTLTTEAVKTLKTAVSKAKSDGNVDYTVPEIPVHYVNKDQFEVRHARGEKTMAQQMAENVKKGRRSGDPEENPDTEESENAEGEGNIISSDNPVRNKRPDRNRDSAPPSQSGVAAVAARKGEYSI